MQASDRQGSDMWAGWRTEPRRNRDYFTGAAVFKSAASRHLSSLVFKKNTRFPLSSHDGHTEQDEFIPPNTPNSVWLMCNKPLCRLFTSSVFPCNVRTTRVRACVCARIVWDNTRGKGKGSKRNTHRLVPHLGVEGCGSGSGRWVSEGSVGEARGQLCGVQRVRGPGIRGCWNQRCPCQIIWGRTRRGDTRGWLDLPSSFMG